MLNGVLAVGVLLCLALPLAYGEIYKWVDQHGKVYFTDNIAAVPPAYRHQVEEKTTTPSVPRHGVSGAGAKQGGSSGSHDSPVAASHTVPLVRAGNAMLVDAVLDGSVPARLLVDTGAELTVIASAVARQLGLKVEAAPVFPLRSASGVFLAPLVKVQSLTVGSATVHDVEAVVHDATPGLGGLLGMSFLDHFEVTIRTNEQKMTLIALAAPPGIETYGGRSKDWWVRKFRFYRNQVEVLKEYLSRQPLPQFEKALRYFQGELETLERQASHAAVPRQWRY